MGNKLKVKRLKKGLVPLVMGMIWLLKVLLRKFKKIGFKGRRGSLRCFWCKMMRMIMRVKIRKL